MKILLSNAAYMGDLINATAVLPALKSAYPEAIIGFLASDWSKAVAEDHLHIDHLHIYNPLGLNRSAINKRAKKEIERKSFKRALSEIRYVGYDIVFELTCYSRYLPSQLFFQAGIKERVGHWSAPTPFHYTQLYFGGDSAYSLVENYQAFFREFGLSEEHVAKMRPSLIYKTSMAQSELLKRLPKEYFLIHMGTGDTRKEWPTAYWKELIHKLSSFSIPLLFVGSGKREKDRIDFMREDHPNTFSLCDELNFRELIEVTRRAAIILGVDSMMGHLASALGVGGLFIYNSNEKPSLWRPFNPIAEIIVSKDLKADSLLSITPEVVFERLLTRLKGKSLFLGEPVLRGLS